jgi:hypothetical protein
MNEDAPTFKIIDTRTGEIDSTVPIQRDRFDLAYLVANKWMVFRADEMGIPRCWLRVEAQEVMEYMGWESPYAA